HFIARYSELRCGRGDILMKGDSNAIVALNKILGSELVVNNQDLLHAHRYSDLWLNELAVREYNESVVELKHDDKLVERILFLEGLPKLQDLGKLHIGENTLEMLKSDLALELKAIPDLRGAIPLCESAKDFVSRDLLKDILESEE